jgi:general secretion pathway protein D
MKWMPGACLAIVLLASIVPARAQSPDSALASTGGSGIPLTDLVVAVAKKANKKFIIDPRAQGTRVMVGPDPARISYDDFLTVLQVHGLVAIDRGDVIQVVPDAMARTFPSPLVTGNEKHPDAEVVTRVIRVHAVPAVLLVPLLRPLIPQLGHLAALKCTNDLILVDRFANTKRLESIIAALDTGVPYKPEKCTEPMPAPAPPAAPAARD